MAFINCRMKTAALGMNLHVILKDKDVEVAPVTSEEYPQKAYRPRHSIMSLKKAEATGFTIPTWQTALQEFMSQIQDNH